jgi:hypothetical protein
MRLHDLARDRLAVLIMLYLGLLSVASSLAIGLREDKPVTVVYSRNGVSHRPSPAHTQAELLQQLTAHIPVPSNNTIVVDVVGMFTSVVVQDHLRHYIVGS